MSTRDDASLTDRERAALASLEAVAAAEDPLLARRLRGTSRLHLVAHLPRIPGWLRSDWCAGPLVLVGMALMLVSMSTTVALGVAGAVVAAVGLRVGVLAVGRRWISSTAPD